MWHATAMRRKVKRNTASTKEVHKGIVSEEAGAKVNINLVS